MGDEVMRREEMMEEERWGGEKVPIGFGIQYFFNLMMMMMMMMWR